LVNFQKAFSLAIGKQAERLSVATQDGGSVRGLDAILEVQHRGSMVPLSTGPRRWDETWGWRWVVPGGKAEGVDQRTKAQDGSSHG
jgi:hypothetical protein